MTETLPLYVIVRGGPTGDALLVSAGPDARALDPDSFLRERSTLDPGLVLVDSASVTAEEILAVARPLTLANHGWTLALTEGEGEARTVRVISLSPSTPIGDVLAHVRHPEATNGRPLELQTVLAEIARLRHDLNNPLTSALAEVQLAIMRAEESANTGTKESLECVQVQLHRIQDVVASTAHLRPTKT